jgi:carnitine 3-dehydrogenase
LQAALWREAISLVRDDAVTLEDVDKADWADPSLSWAALGPTTLFHLDADTIKILVDVSMAMPPKRI